MITERITGSIDFAARNVRAAAAVAPARPAYAAGFRAALATLVPLSVALALGLVSGGTWMSLAGFSGAISDKGGAYASRAIAIACVSLFGALAVLLGATISHHLAVAVPLAFLIALVCSLGRAWGNTGATVGGSVLNMFVISLAYPATGVADALGRAGYVVVGGVWAGVLALVLWPVRPYRPARLAIAACYRRLADYVADVARDLETPASTRDALPAGSLVVRAALEQARATLATIRRGRPGESARGERLLVLRETADQMFGNLIGLVETVDEIPPDARDASANALLLDAMRKTIVMLHEIADRVEDEKQTGVVSVPISGAELRESLTTAVDGNAQRFASAQYVHAAALLDRIAVFAGVASANVASLDGPTAQMPIHQGAVEEIVEPIEILGPLRSVLAPDSLVFRHALRVGLVTAAAVLLAGALELPRGYWVTITVVIIMQPYTGATTLKAFQRVLGTVLGGILTAALGALFHDMRAVLVLAFIFAAVSVALLPINYTAFSVFLTPTFVLLAEASAGDWHLAGVRVMNTLYGGALALIGARILWPAPEWKRLPTYMAAALRANRDYLRTVVETFTDRSEAAGRLMRERRRDAALAAINSEESFQRLLGEHGNAANALAPVMTFLTYTRRLTVSIAALSVSRHSLDPATKTVLGEFAAHATEELDAAAGRLLAADAGAPNEQSTTGEWEINPAPPGEHDPVVEARLTRLERQLQTLIRAADEAAALSASRGRLEAA